MSKFTAITSTSLLLFTTVASTAVIAATTGTSSKVGSQTLTIGGSAFGGHESVEALKEEIAVLQTNLKNASDGREYLLKQLKQAIKREDAASQTSQDLDAAQAASNAETAELQKSLSFMTESRDYLFEELTAANAETEAAGAAAMTDRKSANEEKKKLHARIQKIADQRDALAAQLKESQAAGAAHNDKIAELEKELASAETGRDYLADRLETVLDNTSAENAKLTKKLTAATSGRDYLAERFAMSLDNSAAERAALKQEIDDIAEVSFVQINSAIAERDAARAAAMKAEQEINDIAEVSFAQINSAIAERDEAIDAASDTTWSDVLSADLTDTLSGLDGTEVTARNDNTVSIKVGNTGLFRLGGTILSESGKSVLGSIGNSLADREDAMVRVIGHTDNIPVGTSSRFASNTDLSLARASSALSYLTSVGVRAEQLSASGVGDGYPIASNDTEEGRVANRRVEIVLIPVN